MRDRFSSGLAIGLGVALGVTLLLGSRAPVRPAFGDQTSPSANNEFLMLTASGVSQGEHNIILFDSVAKRLAVYNVKAGTSDLTLIAVRNVGFDVQFEQLGNQKPSVGEVRDLVKKPK